MMVEAVIAFVVAFIVFLALSFVALAVFDMILFFAAYFAVATLVNLRRRSGGTCEVPKDRLEELRNLKEDCVSECPEMDQVAIGHLYQAEVCNNF